MRNPARNLVGDILEEDAILGPTIINLGFTLNEVEIYWKFFSTEVVDDHLCFQENSLTKMQPLYLMLFIETLLGTILPPVACKSFVFTVTTTSQPLTEC